VWLSISTNFKLLSRKAFFVNVKNLYPVAIFDPVIIPEGDVVSFPTFQAIVYLRLSLHLRIFFHTGESVFLFYTVMDLLIQILDFHDLYP